MNKYTDSNFKFWHRLLKSVPYFKNLCEESLREICLNFKKIKISKAKTLIRSNEHSKYFYFLVDGKISIHVVSEHKNTKEKFRKNTKHFFQNFSKFSCINFVNAYLGHSSLFEVI